MTSADESAVKIEEERIVSLSEGGWRVCGIRRAPSPCCLYQTLA
jgi:hypothetical protein